jgi:hypothetical protein
MSGWLGFGCTIAAILLGFACAHFRGLWDD